MKDQPFLRDLAFELGIEGQTLTANQPIDVTAWDSLAIFSVIGNIQRCYNVVLDAKQLQSCKTIGQLLELIESRQGAV